MCWPQPTYQHTGRDRLADVTEKFDNSGIMWSSKGSGLPLQNGYATKSIYYLWSLRNNSLPPCSSSMPYMTDNGQSKNRMDRTSVQASTSQKPLNDLGLRLPQPSILIFCKPCACLGMVQQTEKNLLRLLNFTIVYENLRSASVVTESVLQSLDLLVFSAFGGLGRECAAVYRAGSSILKKNF